MIAIARLAWRNARRRPARSLGVVTLLAFVVALGVTVNLLGGLLLTDGFVVLLMVVIAVVAGSAYTVAVRRNLTQLGQLKAVGASERDLRLLVALEIAIPAVVGALVGVALGWAVSVVLNGGFTWTIDEGEPVSNQAAFVLLSTLIPVVAIGLGLVIAGWGPARIAAKVSVAEAMAGRIPESAQASAGRNVAGGVALGLITLFLVRAGVGGAYVLLVLAVVTGFASASLLLGSSVGVLGERAAADGSGATRFLARDMSRNRLRTQWFLAAALGLSTLCVMAVAGLESDRGVYAPLDDRMLLVQSGPLPDVVTRAPGFVDFEPTSVEEVAAVVDVESAVPFDLTIVPFVIVGGGGWGRQEQAAILTPELADALGLTVDERAAAQSGAVLVSEQRFAELGGTASVRVSTLDLEGGHDMPFRSADFGGVHTGWYTGSELPGVLVSEDRARQLAVEGAPLTHARTGAAVDDGVFSEPSHRTLIVAASPITDAERRQIEALNPDDQSISWPVDRELFGGTSQMIAVVIAVFSGLAVLFARISAVLIGREIEGEVSAMVANGARPSVRRRILAGQTFVQMAVGGLVGAVVGVVLFWMVTRGDSSVPDAIVPWPAIGVMSVGVPVVGAALVWLTSRSGQPSPSKR